MMITLYAIGLFVVALTSVYALIQSRTNRILTFVLIPLVLTISVFSWQVVKMLEGTPIMGLPPQDQETRVLYIHNEKPLILFLVAEKSEEYKVPRYYAIPWTEKAAEEAERMKAQAKRGRPVDGKFTPKSYNDEQSFEFSNIERSNPLMPKIPPMYENNGDSLGSGITSGEPFVGTGVPGSSEIP
jgi:hypothetical protein